MMLAEDEAFFGLLTHTGEKQESGLKCYVSGNKCVSLRQKRVKGKDYGNPSEKRRLATD